MNQSIRKELYAKTRTLCISLHVICLGLFQNTTNCDFLLLNALARNRVSIQIQRPFDQKEIIQGSKKL